MDNKKSIDVRSKKDGKRKQEKKPMVSSQDSYVHMDDSVKLLLHTEDKLVETLEKLSAEIFAASMKADKYTEMLEQNEIFGETLEHARIAVEIIKDAYELLDDAVGCYRDFLFFD